MNSKPVFVTCTVVRVNCLSASSTMMRKNGSMNGSQQKRKIFTYVVFTNCPKDGKNVQQAMEHTFNKEFFVILPSLTRF